MFRCEYGHVFEEMKVEYEVHDELDEKPRVPFGVCPICKTDEIEEVVQCECGEWTADMDSGLCEPCKRRLRKDADAFFMDFTPREKSYVLEWLGV